LLLNESDLMAMFRAFPIRSFLDSLFIEACTATIGKAAMSPEQEVRIVLVCCPHHLFSYHIELAFPSAIFTPLPAGSRPEREFDHLQFLEHLKIFAECRRYKKRDPRQILSEGSTAMISFSKK
jgi:hypothetical protein